jgi:hypothetical protein
MWFSSLLCRPARIGKFSPARPRAKARRGRVWLAVEALEPRTVPATFRPLASAPDGAAASLRADIIRANGNHQNNIIRLQAATYNLALANTAGQDNGAATGDLDLTGAGHTITFIGRGATTVINANQIDRVFQVFPGVHVVFENLTITGGVAQDDGTAGAAPGSTAAEGGGILNQGGSVTLEHVLVMGNAAQGGSAHFGIVGGPPPGLAQNAEGGGIFSTGSLTISKGSAVMNNQAVGGASLAGFGSPGSNGGFRQGGGNGGDGFGGAAGFAEGGGIFVAGGRLLISASVIASNGAIGGNGGSGTGGKGGNGAPGGFAGGNGGLGQGANGGFAEGGGIWAAAGTAVTLTDKSTVSDNTTTGGNAGDGTGGNGGNGGIGLPNGDGTGGPGGVGGSGGAGIGGLGGPGLSAGVFVFPGATLTVKPGSAILINTNTNGGGGDGIPGANGTHGLQGF